ncbi:MAG: TAXI family TRAP transporter solute-binding subunit [Deltaproteobacteria bacterium]|nr:MAG: TAXI family TRAP transporter solute-binding subunit [Deltaproteobacteria bacterium]
MKRIMSLLVVLGIVGLTVVPTATAAQPKIANIGTHAVGSFFNVVGNSVGAIISKHTPIKAKVMPVGISSWMPRMATGEMDLGVLNSTDARWGYSGSESYEKLSKGKGFPIRLLLTGICNDVSIVVRGDLPVRKPSDLKGLSIAAGFAKAPACQLQTTAVLANGDLTWDDVKMVPVPAPAASVKAVLEGRSDAAGTATTGMPAVEELAAKKGARFISLDPSPEAKARALEAYPDGLFNLIKAGKYTGVDEDSWLLRYEIYVAVRKDFPDEAVREILKAMWDFNNELPSYHKKFKEWSREGYASKHLTIPYHPAAVSFLKEKGLWTKALEARQGELLAKKK